VNSLLRSAFLISMVLLVPILPFLFFGEQLTTLVTDWLEQPSSRPATIGIIVGLLATDIFLPIPSSMISTLGGWQLGWLAGTLASWVGLSLGAIAGFSLARRWGRPFALWFTREEELDRMQELSTSYGIAILVLARGVPVLAEASVLLMGVHRLPWKHFLPAVLLSNLGIAWAYSTFGEIAEHHHWLPLALGVSVAFPVLLAAVIERFVARKHRAGNS
jgi:uncharacterized membrane protein YdjX (TVP38/TMEM64 family)